LKAQIAAAEQRAADAEASAQATSEELAKMKVGSFPNVFLRLFSH
jgi:hypothetical protein